MPHLSLAIDDCSKLAFLSEKDGGVERSYQVVAHLASKQNPSICFPLPAFHLAIRVITKKDTQSTALDQGLYHL